MNETTELKTASDTRAEAEVSDRRRPGRLRSVSPELIPILRRESTVNIDPDIDFGEPDQMAGTRGIAMGVMLSAPLWVGIAYLGRWILS